MTKSCDMCFVWFCLGVAGGMLLAILIVTTI